MTERRLRGYREIDAARVTQLRDVFRRKAVDVSGNRLCTERGAIDHQIGVKCVTPKCSDDDAIAVHASATDCGVEYHHAASVLDVPKQRQHVAVTIDDAGAGA